MSVIDGKQVASHGLFALCMGVVAAGASILLCLCVGAVYSLYQAHWWLIFLLPLLGCFSLWLYHRSRLPLDMSTRKVVDSIRSDAPVSPFLAPGILAGTCLSILGGASVGKEAGALQMGASLGSLVGRPFRLKPVHGVDAGESMEGYAAATGMAATFAALFFAPLGSMMFVLELSRYKRSVVKHGVSILLACFVAFAIARVVGIGDIIPTVAAPLLSWKVVGECIVIGVLGALGGTLFSKGVDGLQQLTRRISRNYYLWVIVGGVVIAALTLGFGLQEYGGTGGNLLALALAGTQPTWGFLLKAGFTVLALGLWFKGGEIMPTFTIGALLGASAIVITGGDAPYSAAIGLVAFFTAESRCPVAAFLMGCEIFGWQFAPFFAIAVITSYAFGHDVGMYGRGAYSAVSALTRRAFVRRSDPALAAEAEAIAQAAQSAAKREEASGGHSGHKRERRLSAAEAFVSAKLAEYYGLTSRLEDTLERLHQVEPQKHPQDGK